MRLVGTASRREPWLQVIRRHVVEARCRRTGGAPGHRTAGAAGLLLGCGTAAAEAAASAAERAGIAEAGSMRGAVAQLCEHEGDPSRAYTHAWRTEASENSMAIMTRHLRSPTMLLEADAPVAHHAQRANAARRAHGPCQASPMCVMRDASERRRWTQQLSAQCTDDVLLSNDAPRLIGAPVRPPASQWMTLGPNATVACRCRGPHAAKRVAGKRLSQNGFGMLVEFMCLVCLCVMLLLALVLDAGAGQLLIVAMPGCWCVGVWRCDAQCWVVLP